MGVDLNSATSIIAEYGGAGAWTAGAITTDPRSPIDGYTVSDVTWSLNTAAIEGTNLLLGIFEVTTDPAYSASLPGGYPSIVTNFGYAYSLDSGSVTGSGSAGNGFTIVIGGVPEPSTLTLALCAIATLPVVSFFRRRRSRKVGLHAA